MLCVSLDGKGLWGRMDTCICMAKTLHCSLKTITTLLIHYTPTQIKSLKKKKDVTILGQKLGIILPTTLGLYKSFYS